jgi:hypothetical protein
MFAVFDINTGSISLARSGEEHEVIQDNETVKEPPGGIDPRGASCFRPTRQSYSPRFVPSIDRFDWTKTNMSWIAEVGTPTLLI